MDREELLEERMHPHISHQGPNQVLTPSVFFVLFFFRSATLSDGDPLVIFFGLKRVSERALQDTVTILGAHSRLRAARQHIPLLIEPCISQKWARPSKRPCSVCVRVSVCFEEKREKNAALMGRLNNGLSLALSFTSALSAALCNPCTVSR